MTLQPFFSLLMALLFVAVVQAQCPAGHVTLGTQEQVDAFVKNYPSCTTITGNLSIGQLYPAVSDIHDLSGLNHLTTITGNLNIGNNLALTTLNGLQQITAVGGSLDIVYNPVLLQLNGLNHLVTVGGAVRIWYNNALASLGMDALTNVGTLGIESLSITGNPVLTQLNGLNHISTIPGKLMVYDNARLLNLTGLGNIVWVNGEVIIANNLMLNSLSGLGALRYVYGGLEVYQNQALPNMNGLAALEFVLGKMVVTMNPNMINLAGLTALNFVGNGLRITMNHAMTSLHGLNNLQTIAGNLEIDGNNGLTTLSGLNNLVFVTDDVSIANNSALTNVNGLDNLFQIGSGLYLYHNGALNNLLGLWNLHYLSGILYITDNDALTHLHGLNNIYSWTITSLTIKLNDNLGACSIENLCNYLSAPFNPTGIYGNATGCNSRAEIEAACGLAAMAAPTEQGLEDSPAPAMEETSARRANEGPKPADISAFPNPTTGLIQLKGLAGSLSTVQVLDSRGTTVRSERTDTGVLDLSTLPSGAYLLRVKTAEHAQLIRVLKE